MILAFLLISFGFYVMIKSARKKNKPTVQQKTEGEVLKNKYIIEHEKKLQDDKVYEEYLDWCKFKGEIPVDKEGYDEHRMKEFQMYKKLIKHGIGGL